jgi:bacteriocin biosynthesis cyclodehydratase domain-containing protein
MAENERLRLKKYYSLVAHSPDDIELRYGVWNPTSFTLTDESKSGRLFRLMARLDGSVSPVQLAKEEDVPLEEVEALVDHLSTLGVVESTAGSSLDYYLDNILPWQADSNARPDRPIVLLGDLDLAAEIKRYLSPSLPKNLATIVDQCDPAWIALSDGDASWLSDGLRFQEKLLTFEKWRDSFIVFATKIINPVQLRMLNRICLDYRIQWIHAVLDGPFLFVGPIFVPHRSPCYECLEMRIMMNLRESASYQRYKHALVQRQVKNGQFPIEPVIGGMLASHTAMETLNFLLTGSSFTVNKLLAIYLPTMEFTYNEVLRAPSCTACSPSSERDDKELYFDMGKLINQSKASSTKRDT